VETYKSRVKKAISDFQRYGLNPTGMNSWNPKITVRKKKNDQSKIQELTPENVDQNIEKDEVELSSNKTTKFELPLRENTKAIILLPTDITKKEIAILRKYIDFLDSIAKEEPENISKS
jgi:uncharacterized ferritin-like protein (DUF455 family)